MDRDGLDWPRYALIRTGPARSLHVRLRKPQIPDPPLTGPAPLSPHRAPSALASATGDADELPFGQLGLQLEDGRRVAQREPDVRLRGFPAVRVPRRVSRRSYTRGAENDHRPDNPSNPAPSCHRPCFLLRFRLIDRFRQVSPGVCRTGIRSRYGARPVVLTVGTLTTPQRAHPRGELFHSSADSRPAAAASHCLAPTPAASGVDHARARPFTVQRNQPNVI